MFGSVGAGGGGTTATGFGGTASRAGAPPPNQPNCHPKITNSTSTSPPTIMPMARPRFC